MTKSRYRSDIWQPGILHAPISHVQEGRSLLDVPITWLPEQRPFCFLADPFGVWRNDHLHVFVEAYDYRDKHGVIQRFTYDANFKLVDQGGALRAKHHLSYPFIIEDAGEIFMLPEAHHSGKLTLYRAARFPDDWQKVCDLLPLPAVDASVVKHGALWWMFYALHGPDHRAMRELHVASAPQLTGPWTPHPQNPVRTGFETSRPGGTPFMAQGCLYVPTQDCRTEYGAALTLLRIDELTPTTWAATPTLNLPPSRVQTTFNDGLHTLSACGDVTLLDVKRIERSGLRALINLQRRFSLKHQWRRLTHR